MTIETEASLEILLDKLERWLIMQPEWVLVFNHDRASRRRAADLVAKELTTIPQRIDQPLNRKLRRTILAALKNGAL